MLHYLGDYELLEEIARGGMGVVYRARQVSLNRTVAVKLLPFAAMATPDQVKRFRREAEAAAHLQHPNIVAIYEVGEHQGQQYFSMEYVEGRDLSTFVHDTALPAARAARYARAIAEAVHYAHQHQTLHRDLKPSNVLIGLDDQPRITDFGLAKRFGVESQNDLRISGFVPPIDSASRSSNASRQLTITGQILGTPGFMPPEQATAGRGQVGPASDVYSIGAILYYLVTARPPFAGETFENTLAQLLNEDPPAPRLLNPAVPRDLETICLKCLRKQPAGRYLSAEDLRADLDRFLRGQPIQAHPSSAWDHTVKWVRRRPAVAALLATVFLVAALGFGGIFVQLQRKGEALRQAELRRRIFQLQTDVIRRLNASVDAKTPPENLDASARNLDLELKNYPDIQADLRDTLGSLYATLGDLAKAEGQFREALNIRRRLHGNADPEAASLLNSLALVIHKGGNQGRTNAEPYYREALAMGEQLWGPDDSRQDAPRNNLAFLLRRLAKLPESEALYRKSFDLAQQRHGTNSIEAAAAASPLAVVMMEHDRFEPAEALVRWAVTILTNRAPDDWRSFDARSVLGGALFGLRRFADAEPHLVEGCQGLNHRAEINSFVGRMRRLEALERLVRFYSVVGPPEKAASWKLARDQWLAEVALANDAAGGKAGFRSDVVIGTNR